MRVRTLEPYTNIIIISLTVALSIDFRLQKAKLFWFLKRLMKCSNIYFSIKLKQSFHVVTSATSSAGRYKFLLRRMPFGTLNSSILTEVGRTFYKNRFYDMCFLYGQLFSYSMDVADMDDTKWILVIVNHKPPVPSSVVQSFVGIQLQ